VSEWSSEMSDERETPPDGLLELLNGWPEGTRGFIEEQMLLRQLRSLAATHGFGRLHGLITGLATLNEADPTRIDILRAARRQRVADMKKQMADWTAPKKEKVKA
jgi:hypothetical protein